MKSRFLAPAVAFTFATITAAALDVRGATANLGALIGSGSSLSVGGATFSNFSAGGNDSASTYTVNVSTIDGGTSISFTSSAPTTDIEIGYSFLTAAPVGSTGLTLAASIPPNSFASVGETITATNNYSLSAFVSNNQYGPDSFTDAANFATPQTSGRTNLSIDTGAMNGAPFTIASVTDAYLYVPTPGDANGDGNVDLNDLNIVLNHLGVVDSLRSDGNFDGAPAIDLNDLNQVLNNLGTRVGSAAAPLTRSSASVIATPEPSALAVLGAGSIASFLRRKHLFLTA